MTPEQKTQQRKRQNTWARNNREKKRAASKRYYAANLEKMRTRGRARYAAHRDEELAKERTRHAANPNVRKNAAIKRRYKITLDDKQRMYAEQDGRCAIHAVCEGPLLFEDSQIDHAHGSGQVRGLVCSACNLLLGRMGDTLEEVQSRSEKLEQYLLKSRVGSSNKH